jgi:hypothetical protein
LAKLLRHVVQNFDLDRQLGQERRLVLWCEAAGMLAQLERVASRSLKKSLTLGDEG